MTFALPAVDRESGAACLRRVTEPSIAVRWRVASMLISSHTRAGKPANAQNEADGDRTRIERHSVVADALLVNLTRLGVVHTLCPQQSSDCPKVLGFCQATGLSVSAKWPS
jgi:hypothetical protein